MIAVLTSDLVKSKEIPFNKRRVLLNAHKKWIKGQGDKFEIFRGDSIQGTIKTYQNSLSKALELITLTILLKAEIRISIGIGSIEFNANKVVESDGIAFRLSGDRLNKMHHEQRIIISTESKFTNDILHTISTLLNGILTKWSSEQAEAIYYSLIGDNQEAISHKLKISQSAVNQRLKAANWNDINYTNQWFINNIEALCHL